MKAAAAPVFVPDDLYADARPVLEVLRDRGIRTAVAGNFDRRIAGEVQGWGLAADPIVPAEELGAEKPDPAFFSNLAAALRVQPAGLLYVGDRIDNDVLAARAAGCGSVFLRRGPWAAIQEPVLSHNAPVIDSLEELVDLLG